MMPNFTTTLRSPRSLAVLTCLLLTASVSRLSPLQPVEAGASEEEASTLTEAEREAVVAARAPSLVQRAQILDSRADSLAPRAAQVEDRADTLYHRAATLAERGSALEGVSPESEATDPDGDPD